MALFSSILTKIVGKEIIKSRIAHDAVQAVDELADVGIKIVRKFGEDQLPGVAEEGLDLAMDVVEIGKDIVTGGSEVILDIAEDTIDIIEDTFGGISDFFGF